MYINVLDKCFITSLFILTYYQLNTKWFLTTKIITHVNDVYLKIWKILIFYNINPLLIIFNLFLITGKFFLNIFRSKSGKKYIYLYTEIYLMNLIRKFTYCRIIFIFISNPHQNLSVYNKFSILLISSMKLQIRLAIYYFNHTN